MCVQQRVFEREELFGGLVATVQPVPIPLPPVVLVDLGWGGRDIGRTRADLAPLLPLFLVVQLEGTCIQQRVLEREELFGGLVATVQPVPVPLPPVVLVDLGWGGGDIGRTRAALAPLLLLLLVLQLEGACTQQRVLEREELLVLFDTNVTGAQPVPVTLPIVVLVDLVWS